MKKYVLLTIGTWKQRLIVIASVNLVNSHLSFGQCVAHPEPSQWRVPLGVFSILRNLNVPFKAHIDSATPSSGLKDTESYFSFLPRVTSLTVSEKERVFAQRLDKNPVQQHSRYKKTSDDLHSTSFLFLFSSVNRQLTAT